jgi:hypothetical protein
LKKPKPVIIKVRVGYGNNKRSDDQRPLNKKKKETKTRSNTNTNDPSPPFGYNPPAVNDRHKTILPASFSSFSSSSSLIAIKTIVDDDIEPSPLDEW